MAKRKETVEQVCEDLEKYICGDDDIVYSLTGDEAIEYKDRFLAAHKRELAAKDTEIESLHALVKELADALENEIDKINPDYDLVDALVARARGGVRND